MIHGSNNKIYNNIYVFAFICLLLRLFVCFVICQKHYSKRYLKVGPCDARIELCPGLFF